MFRKGTDFMPRRLLDGLSSHHFLHCTFGLDGHTVSVIQRRVKCFDGWVAVFPVLLDLLQYGIFGLFDLPGFVRNPAQGSDQSCDAGRCRHGASTDGAQ